MNLFNNIDQYTYRVAYDIGAGTQVVTLTQGYYAIDAFITELNTIRSPVRGGFTAVKNADRTITISSTVPFVFVRFGSA